MVSCSPRNKAPSCRPVSSSFTSVAGQVFMLRIHSHRSLGRCSWSGFIHIGRWAGVHGQDSFTSVTGQVFMVWIPGIPSEALCSRPVTLADKHAALVVFA